MTPPEDGEPCSSIQAGSASDAMSNTNTPSTVLPGLMSAWNRSPPSMYPSNFRPSPSSAHTMRAVIGTGWWKVCSGTRSPVSLRIF
jgi:hypothetical protein